MTAATITLAGPTFPLAGHAALPASKSESNRVLILRALAGGGNLTNLSAAHDTQLMQRLLAETAQATELNAEDAGTVMRFLTAYLAVTGWRGRLTGTARMQERPIGVLVGALRELGAGIEYEGKEGFPPLRFLGFQARETTEMPLLTVRGDISSQYISALMMIGAVLPQGLRLQLTGAIGSRPYIQMTVDLMRRFGGGVLADKPATLVVFPSGCRPADYIVESDWSAASYWYAMVALGPAGSAIFLAGLRRESYQGDQAIARIMADFGVSTHYHHDGVQLRQQGQFTAAGRTYDFTDCPDLAQTVAVVAAAQSQRVALTGLDSLRIKETDRIAALQTELAKFGAQFSETSAGVFQVSASELQINGQTVATYHDHRMAMAFAPLALRGSVRIEAPEVVRKSYPSFWAELAQAGFTIH